MYVDKDKDGRISINNLTEEDAEYLNDCICCYLSGKSTEGRSDAERRLILLHKEKEKNY